MSLIPEIALEQITHIKEKCLEIRPLVVIQCLAYNHSPYLKDALEGFVMQKTDFPFVAVVHEDASTDNTAEILREYSEKYPDTILPIFEKENQYSKPGAPLTDIIEQALQATGAKYIAVCEGDDYWISTDKLQKQVDFLESHSDYTYTCHRYKDRKGLTLELTEHCNLYLDKHPKETGFSFDIEYPFLFDWVTKTLTAVFRYDAFINNPYRQAKYYRDVHMNYHILSQGKGYCFNSFDGVYRIQPTSTWSSMTSINQADLTRRLYAELDELTNSKLSRKIAINTRNFYYLVCIKSKKVGILFRDLNIFDLIKLPFWYFYNKSNNRKIMSRTEKLNKL